MNPLLSNNPALKIRKERSTSNVQKVSDLGSQPLVSEFTITSPGTDDIYKGLDSPTRGRSKAIHVKPLPFNPSDSEEEGDDTNRNDSLALRKDAKLRL